MLIRFCMAALAAVLLSGCASLSEHATGLTADGELQPCPSAPRCVSSVESDPERQVEPLRLSTADDETWQGLLSAVKALPRTEVVVVEPNYLHAEVTSPWRVYTDDVELLRRPDGRTLEIRSSGRIGYYDFNVNRERVAFWRQTLEEQGLLVQTSR